MQTENITNNYDSINEVLKQNLIKLRKNIDISNVTNVLHLSELKKLEEQIAYSNSFQSRMKVMLLKDISFLLLFISASRESDIDFHLECE